MRASRCIYAKTFGALMAKISYKRRLAYTKKLYARLLENAENGFEISTEVKIR